MRGRGAVCEPDGWAAFVMAVAARSVVLVRRQGVVSQAQHLSACGLSGKADAPQLGPHRCRTGSASVFRV